MIEKIKKRDGSLVDFNPDKLMHWAKWAAGIGVDWFSIAAEAYKRCPNECTTQELQNAMIQACTDKEDTPHLKMAGRLLMGDIYKQAFGGHKNIPTVLEMYKKMVSLGLWEDMGYTDEELIKAESFINHDKDLHSLHSVIHQISTKYATKDIESNTVLESPAFVWMRMALGVCVNEPTSSRIDEVKAYYLDFSESRINAPTPNIINLGSPRRNYASCAIFKSNDTAQSLAAGDHIAYNMTVASAGVGAMLQTRSKGEGVRKNTIRHGGKLPYYEVIGKGAKANKQGSRGGAVTMHFNCLDPEIETLLRLRHPTTVTAQANRDLDYSFGYHPYLAEKAAKNEQWMLVSYKQSPELHEALYSGVEGVFEKLYDEYEASKKKRKYINARKLALEFLRMQEETGRMYEHNTFEMNRHTPFKDIIYSSNLCQETGLPTQGFKNVQELYKEEYVQGEIGLCNLAAIVAGNVSDEQYPEVAYRALKMIDNVINMMDYPFPNLKFTAQARRSAGVGVTNLAYDMASKGLSYKSKEGKDYMHRLAETHSYWLHKASVRLAKERGKCNWYEKTKYADGCLLIDTAKDLSDIVDQTLQYDWEGLRKEITEHGVRFSVLEAFMPVESSSIAGNTTNGIYPIRERAVIKTSGNNKTVFLAPDWELLKDRYESAWDIPRKDITDMYAIFQKFTGQGISADFWRKFDSSEARSISAKELLEDWFYRIKRGLKTKYYSNSAAGLDLFTQDAAEAGESDCESCKL